MQNSQLLIDSTNNKVEVKSKPKFSKLKSLLFGAAVLCTLSASALPASAQSSGSGGGTANTSLTNDMASVTASMTMLAGIADAGVSIVIVPFSIGYALKIAGHVLKYA